MYSSFCYALHHSKYIKTFVFILLLFFFVFSSFCAPIQEADAFVWALPALAGGEALVDLALGGLLAGGIIAADTYIKNSDLYKTVTAFLGSLTAEELAKVEEIGSAGQAAYSTAAISGLLSKALTACNGLTVYSKASYGSVSKGRLLLSSLTELGYTQDQINKLSADINTHNFYAPFYLSFAGYKFVVYGGGVLPYLSSSVLKTDAVGKPILYSNGINSIRPDSLIYDFESERSCYLKDTSFYESMLSRGKFAGTAAVGYVYGYESTYSCKINGICSWLVDDLASIPDVINVPEAGLSICPDVTLAPDTAIAENWATDYTMSGSISTSPSVTLNPELAGDVVITPGDIGGGGEVVDPDVPTDGTIAGLLSALLDWLKGILQSILDAIRSIPAAITGLLQSIIDAIVAIPAAILDIIKNALTWAFVPEDGYFQGKYEALEKLLNARFGTVAIDLTVLSGATRDSGSPFQDITVTIFGSTVTIVSFESLETAIDYFRPVIIGFIGILGMIYNYNNIYRLLHGSPYIGSSGSKGSDKKGKGDSA